MDKPKGFQFAIDRGGTFTDVFARCPSGKVKVMKLLSVDPQNYDDAPREAIRRILQEETGNAVDKDGKVNSSLIESIRMGTTVATNALLERKGAKMALVINKGFKDLLYIGNQARPHIFDLNIKRPGVLYTEVVEVDCRVIPALEDRCQIDKSKLDWKEVYGTTGQKMLVVKDIDEEAVRQDLSALREKGIDSIAVVLAHSYTYRDHELRIGKIANDLGFNQVSLSHAVTSMVRVVPRGFTATADAYLTPHIREYVRSFASGFADGLRSANVLFMQSDGGLTPMNMFNGSRAILSGPAGGVVGYALTSYHKETGLPVIGFDMGGTSTDVSRYAGALEHVHEATTAGVTIQAPQLDINTVAAGGGSVLWFRAGLLGAGPQSAAALPGPACYRRAGPLTVTDANLLLGRLLPEYFPKIFGPTENEPLDKEATIAGFKKITDEINTFLKQDGSKQMTMEEVAMGFINVANETMCRPIRSLTTARGHDARTHALACFGGAGGQHACRVAARLGVTSVLVHKYAGILSAYGMALADVVQEEQEPCADVYCAKNYEHLDTQLDRLSALCREKLRAQGFTDEQIVLEPYLHLRYAGTDCALMVSPTDGASATRHGDFYTAFITRYKNEFGFTLSERDVLVDDVRVRGIGKSLKSEEIAPPSGKGITPPVEKVVQVYFEGGYQDTAIYLLEKLMPDQQISGPAIIMDSLSTILVEPGSRADITKYGDIRITIGAGQNKMVTADLDSVQLSIFSHRFMSIAEQMGRVLQRTSISVNIKERLDFSCALFGADGGLVSNAPHIPVHLGAMQETVQYQMKVRGDSLRPGDVLLSNHPRAGGSHLPDLTVITPVFHESTPRPIFFVASRGHHADIGGLTPGSMPPHSTSLQQEGAAFKSMLLVEGGTFNEEELVEELMKPGKVPGCSGTRNLGDNLSDLKAQVAANQRGIQLVSELIEEYSLEVVQAYMTHIQKNAELAVRDMLKEIAKKAIAKTGSSVLKATEYMDNGTPIVLTVTLDPVLGGAVCDFTGTGVEVWGNMNAPRAITMSALIYCLRCMVGHDVPLNQGCLQPVTVIIPPGCLLDPSDSAAVVAGNVLTSQRLVDVVLSAFQVCAASQGCTNNLTLGESSWGYYETVAGGSGAGPGWHGASGVHTHMTNTRITDVEIVETRYPMLVTSFSLRPGSGGRGRWRGGEGVTRALQLRRSVQLSVLSERRALQPYGMDGGEPGARGLNLLQRADGRLINLGGKSSVEAFPGEIAKKAIAKTGSSVLKATEYMDNGTPIVLTVTLDPVLGGAVCDFTGTGVEVWGNMNAPRAITMSALIYCLRCMVGHDVPLNQGCLQPVTVIIPPGCLLDPSDSAAVVAGNVLTSQRLVDVVLSAFQVCAASQGCTNNLTLGESSWGYYETVAGGSGAGPGWHGASGVHTHMTNTRITDVEIVETRYPMLVTSFSLRPGSGGRGRWCGGEGVTRTLLLRRSVQLSVLSERRALQPYGMDGGEPGARGLNLLQRADGRLINLGGKSSVEALPGDIYIMNSPGGGGYGRASDEETDKQTESQNTEFLERGSLFEYRNAQESV